jgi:tripartite ATP-independent transporter DctP family solute receptor
MFTRVLFLTLTSLFLFLLLIGCTPKAIDYDQVSEEEKLVIRFSHVVGEDTPKGQAARLFSKLIDEKTNGKVEVQVFSNGSLYKDAEELVALREGYIHMIAPSLSKLTPIVPELGVFDLPYLYTSIEEYHHAFDGPSGKFINKKFEVNGLKPLGFWDNGFKQFTHNIHPIHMPTDLSGTKIRIMPSSVLDQQYALLKAKPIEMPFHDVFSALEDKKVDGQENTISNIYTKKFHQVQKFMTISNHGYLGYVVLMDHSFWNTLSPTLQNIIVETMQEVTEWERQNALQINSEQYTRIQQCECIKISELENTEIEEWKSFFQPLYQKVSKVLDEDFTKSLKLTNF